MMRALNQDLATSLLVTIPTTPATNNITSRAKLKRNSVVACLACNVTIWVLPFVIAHGSTMQREQPTFRLLSFWLFAVFRLEVLRLQASVVFLLQGSSIYFLTRNGETILADHSEVIK
jgi:hypothetical protein